MMPLPVLLLITYPVMAGQFAATKIGLAGGLSVLDVAGLRYLGCALAAAPLFLRADVRRLLAATPGRFLLLGLAGGGFYGLGFAQGIAMTPASHGALFVPGFSIATTLVLAGLVHRQWPDPVRWAGVAAILLGLTLFVAGSRTGFDRGAIPGDALLAGIGVLWGVTTFLMRHWAFPPAASIASFAAVGLPVVGLWLALSGPSPALAAPGPALLQTLYQGVLLTVVAFMAWGALVVRIGPALTVIGVASVPVMALGLGIPVLGEWPTPQQVAAALVVVTGIALASGAIGALIAGWRQRRSAT